MANTLQFCNLLTTIACFLNSKFVGLAITISQKFGIVNWVILDWSLEYGTALVISLTEMLVSLPPVMEFLGTLLTPPYNTFLAVLRHNLNNHFTCDCGQGSDYSIWGWISSFPPSAISWDSNIKFPIFLWLIKGFYLLHSICHTLFTDSLSSTLHNSNMVSEFSFIGGGMFITSKFCRCLMPNTVSGSQNYPPVYLPLIFEEE